jgi:hypothetical protein
VTGLLLWPAHEDCMIFSADGRTRLLFVATAADGPLADPEGNDFRVLDSEFTDPYTH